MVQLGSFSTMHVPLVTCLSTCHNWDHLFAVEKHLAECNMESLADEVAPDAAGAQLQAQRHRFELESFGNDRSNFTRISILVHKASIA